MFDYQRVIPFFEVSKLYKELSELSSCTPSATAADKTGSRGSLLACATVKLCIVCFFPTPCGSSCWLFRSRELLGRSCISKNIYQKMANCFRKHISLLFWFMPHTNFRPLSCVYPKPSKLPGASDGAHATFLFGLRTRSMVGWRMQSQVSSIYLSKHFFPQRPAHLIIYCTP